MPDVRPPAGTVAHYVIALEHTPRAVERLVAVPGIRTTAEGEQGPFFWRHFGDTIVDVMPVSEQPQPAACGLPVTIQVQKHSDQLALAVDMNLAVFPPRATANRKRG